MTEIRVDVDLAHPPQRVWCAITEAHLVTEWLSTNRFLLTDDLRFTFRATALKGLDDLIEGRVVATESPHRLVMQWTSVNLHTTVTLTVRAVAGGTRLSLVQQGFLGPHGAMRRRLLQRSYVELFEGPLTATLDRLRSGSGELPAGSAGSSAATVESKRNDGRAYERIPRQTRSSSARGVVGSSHPVVVPVVAAVATGSEFLSPDLSVSSGPSGSVAGSSGSVAGRSGSDSAPSGSGFAPSGPGSAPSGSAGAESGVSSEFGSGSSVDVGSGSSAGSVWSKARRLAKAGLRRLSGRASWTDDRRSQTVAASTALLLLLAMAALLVGRATSARPAGPPQVGGGAEDTIQATVPAQPDARTSIRRLSPDLGRASPFTSSPVGAQPLAATASAQAAAIPLLATYKTEKTGVSNYDASITIRNNGTGNASDWTVIISLPLLGLAVLAVTGAVVTQNGKQVTFTPVDATRTVPPGATVRFTFQLAGLGHPDACTINGQPCSGVPG